VSDYTVKTSVRIPATQRIKLVLNVGDFGAASFWLEGLNNVKFNLEFNHSDNKRMYAAVAAFNAMMDEKEESK
jgi:hypothetical protein